MDTAWRETLRSPMSCSPTMTLDHQPGQCTVWASDFMRRQCSFLKDNTSCPCSLHSRMMEILHPAARMKSCRHHSSAVMTQEGQRWSAA